MKLSFANAIMDCQWEPNLSCDYHCQTFGGENCVVYLRSKE